MKKAWYAVSVSDDFYGTGKRTKTATAAMCLPTMETRLVSASTRDSSLVDLLFQMRWA